MNEYNDLVQRIADYWTKRSADFAQTRKYELADSISCRWLDEMRPYLPDREGAKILDVGTGTGYFAILLSACGYEVTAIDLTEAMLQQAKMLAAEYDASILFRQMDAQRLDFADKTFDAVVTRNLTWTLPDLPSAYCEWHRVLKPGGVLMNFDADYGGEVRQFDDSRLPETAYQHYGMTPELIRESNQITREVSANKSHRPDLDVAVMKSAGFTGCCCDHEAGGRILRERNGEIAPLFMLYGKKGVSTGTVRPTDTKVRLQ